MNVAHVTSSRGVSEYALMSFPEQTGARFLEWLHDLPHALRSRIHIVCDFDGDGLPAGALLFRALAAAGYTRVTVECRRKGESAWGEEIAARLHALNLEQPLDALIVADLGSRDGDILPGVPLLLIDHHRPIGQPQGSTLLTSYGLGEASGDGRDIPTTGLLCWWCALALCGQVVANQWLWLAAISILSDLGDKAPFPELAAARRNFPKLRLTPPLLNAPRRTSEGRADAALDLLIQAKDPKDLLSGRLPQLAELLKAKTEVAEALAIARRQPPRFSKAVRDELGADLVAIRMHTGCQVHPLVAQQWRGRFPRSVVFGVNTGYRPGWVAFSGRAPAGVNLIEFLARHRPESADNSYGLGHNQASGGTLRVPVWNTWIQQLGFGEEMVVSDSEPALASSPPAEVAEEELD